MLGARKTVLVMILVVSLPTWRWAMAPICAEEVQVDLTERTTCDNWGISIYPFYREPQEELTLPNSDAERRRYLKIWCSPHLGDDKLLAVLVVPGPEADSLHIDFNNNEDLTNDGKARAFPRSDNSFTFYIAAKHDPKQKVGYVLRRAIHLIPGRNDSVVAQLPGFADEDGNIRPRVAKTWSRECVDFEGKRGTFYYDDRLILSRGRMTLSGREYQIGLLDKDVNGRFDDPDDMVIVDLDGTGGLSKYVKNEIFGLTDIIAIGGRNYRLTYVDPYGSSVQLSETDEAPTSLFRKAAEKEPEMAEDVAGRRGDLSDAFWGIELASIDGDRISVVDLKGRYILLNCWGEWCGPCITEMPTLVRARARYPEDKLAIIGLLRTGNLEVARRVMGDAGMNWPQVLLTKKLSGLFKVLSYPTNILILPDGIAYVEAGMIGDVFFSRHVK